MEEWGRRILKYVETGRALLKRVEDVSGSRRIRLVFVRRFAFSPIIFLEILKDFFIRLTVKD